MLVQSALLLSLSVYSWCQISLSLFLCVFASLSLSPPVSGLTILNERTAQCQSALGKLQRGRKAKPSMRLSTCLIHTKERALKHKSLLVSIFGSVMSKLSLSQVTKYIHCNGLAFLSLCVRYQFSISLPSFASQPLLPFCHFCFVLSLRMLNLL